MKVPVADFGKVRIPQFTFGGTVVNRFAVALSWLVGITIFANAAEPVKRHEWKVGDTTREALIHAPANATKETTPVVFFFHGHGGTMKHAAEKIAIHSQWPEAICVYPQGLNTPGKLTDPEGKKTGWQFNAGEQNDRDLKFFDEILKSLRKDYKVDDKRIYATGHSNGGRFTYLLWAERGDTFAAVAPSGATAAMLVRTMKPLPCLHIAGEKDELVSFASQQRTMDMVRKVNNCEADGKAWKKDQNPSGTLYAAKDKGAAFVSLAYPGGHTFPADAPKWITAFLKEHTKK